MKTKTEKFCKKCGKLLVLTKNQYYKRYCSLKCSRNMKDKYCLRCGKLLTFTKRQRQRNYCSHECAFVKGKNGVKRSPEETERLRKIASIGGIKRAKMQVKSSKGEILLAELLVKKGYEVERNVWDIVKGYEIDIFLPDLKVAISYDGDVHRLPIYGQKRLNQVINRDKYRSRKLKEMGMQQFVFKIKNRIMK